MPTRLSAPVVLLYFVPLVAGRYSARLKIEAKEYAQSVRRDIVAERICASSEFPYSGLLHQIC